MEAQNCYPTPARDIYSDLYFEVDPICHQKEKEGAAVCCAGIEKLDLAAAGGGARVAGGKRSVYLMNCAPVWGCAAAAPRWRTPARRRRGSRTCRCACSPAAGTSTGWASTSTRSGCLRTCSAAAPHLGGGPPPVAAPRHPCASSSGGGLRSSIGGRI
jgi:hypothetical protein